MKKFIPTIIGGVMLLGAVVLLVAAPEIFKPEEKPVVYFSSLKESIKLGDEYAIYHMGWMYAEGHDSLTRDMKKAEELWIQAADSGLYLAQHQLGEYYLSSFDKDRFKKAAPWWEKAANQGYEPSQCRIADCYFFGNGVKRNRKTANEWYLKAAEQGSGYAQMQLGWSYYKGYGVDVDREKAKEWWEKAAANGYEHAKKNIISYFGD